MSDHAKFSPSSAHRWMHCPASIAMEDGLPSTTSAYAEEGTRAHEVAAYVLQNGIPYVPLERCDNEDMRENVQMYVDSIRRHAYDKILLVESRVEFSNAIGIPDQFGTSDAIVINGATGNVDVRDLKYGMGHRVTPIENEQMLSYAVAVRETYEELLGIPFQTFTMGVHQPRLDHEEDWTCTAADVENHAEAMKAAAARAEQALIWKRKGKQIPQDYFLANEDTCQWCKAKATCPALAAKVAETVFDDFKALDNIDKLVVSSPPAVPPDTKLGEKYGLLGLIEMWCSSIRAELERCVFAGEKIIGPDGEHFKLIEGKRGSRAWKDEKAAEGLLIGVLPPDKAYKPREIITASAAAKILDKKKTQHQWENFKPLITQAPGKPKVALGSDPAPVYTGEAQSSEFSDLTSEVSV